MIEATKSCTGCRACEQVCPTHAISIRENSEGFAYPEVDANACIHCDLCDKHCHLLQAKPSTEPVTVVGVMAKSSEPYIQSTSAGVFAAIAETVLAQKGCVFGCAYDAHMKPQHRMIESMDELSMLQGSKYVESDIEDCYSQVKRQVQSGRLTLFSGTGCQVAGLNAFLGKTYDNLLTVGLICHGVPSRKLFEMHVAEVERKYNKQLTNELFRTKTKPKLGYYCFTHVFKTNKSVVERGFYYAYYRSFLNGETYRESCYECRYATTRRDEDLTIGDYWGAKRFHPEISVGSHPSVVLAHTDKGRTLLEHLPDSLKLLPSRLEWAQAENTQLARPTARPAIRSVIFQTIAEKGYDRWERDYHRSAAYRRKWVREHIPRWVKTLAKSLLGR